MDGRTEKSDRGSTQANIKSVRAELVLDPVELYRRLELLAIADDKARTHRRVKREQGPGVQEHAARRNGDFPISEEYRHAPQFAARQFMTAVGSGTRKGQLCSTTSNLSQQSPSSCSATHQDSVSSRSSRPPRRVKPSSCKLADYERQPDKQCTRLATLQQPLCKLHAHTKKSVTHTTVLRAESLPLLGVQDMERSNHSIVGAGSICRNVKPTAQQLLDRRGWTQDDECIVSVRHSTKHERSNAQIHVTSIFRALSAKIVRKT